MPDYANGRNVLLRRPEPGRPAKVVEKNIVQNVNIDTNAIADAVIKAIVGKMPNGVNVAVKVTDDFDNSESLKKLADAMVIKNQEYSNLEGLGKTKEIKKDNKEVDKAIDMLSKLGD